MKEHSTTEFTLQSAPEYSRVLLSIPEYSRVFLSTPEYSRVLHFQEEQEKTSWKSLLLDNTLG